MMAEEGGEYAAIWREGRVVEGDRLSATESLIESDADKADVSPDGLEEQCANVKEGRGDKVRELAEERRRRSKAVLQRYSNRAKTSSRLKKVEKKYCVQEQDEPFQQLYSD